MTRVSGNNKLLKIVLALLCLLFWLQSVHAQNTEETPGEKVPTQKSDDSPWDDASEIDPFESEMDEFAGGQDSEQEADTPWPEESAAAPWENSTAAEKLELGGRVKNKFALDTHDNNEFEDLFQNHLLLQLDTTYRPYASIEAKISLQADHYTYGRDTDWKNDSNFRLLDAYVNFAGQGVNLKVGNQIVRWGKADGYSPLDNVNPEDLRDGIGGRREDRKMQIPMANLEFYKGRFTIQALYIPFFIKSRYDLKGTDWALYDHYQHEIGAFAIHEQDLSDIVEESEAGLKMAGIAGKFDYAFSYLYTHEDVASLDSLATPIGFEPQFSSHVIKDLARFAQATDQAIHMSYQRQSIYGFEFETTVSAFGLRGDLAYTDSLSYTTEQLKRIQKPVLQYWVGADYNGPGAFYVNVQFGQIYIQDFDETILLAEEISSIVNGTISKEFSNGDVKLEFRYYYDFSGDGALYNPKCIANFWRNLKLEIGIEFFDGTDAHPLGFYRINDQAYATVEWLF